MGQRLRLLGPGVREEVAKGDAVGCLLAGTIRIRGYREFGKSVTIQYQVQFDLVGCVHGLLWMHLAGVGPTTVTGRGNTDCASRDPGPTLRQGRARNGTHPAGNTPSPI
jgi:hypothetical protein